jgi:hypothetical protein
MTPGRTVRPVASNSSPALVADGDDLAAPHADVGEAPPRVIDHLAAAHDQVEGLGHGAAPAEHWGGFGAV